jgi:hypothetical protein
VLVLTAGEARRGLLGLRGGLRHRGRLRLLRLVLLDPLVLLVLLVVLLTV